MGMKQVMSPKQEMARLTLASISLLLVGLMTTPLLESPSRTVSTTRVEEPARPIKAVTRKIESGKANTHAKKSKRLVVARR